MKISENKKDEMSSLQEMKVAQDLGDSAESYNRLQQNHLSGNKWLSRLFPSNVAKELIAAEVELAKKEVCFRQRIHGVIREFESQVVTELANDGLINMKSLIRKNRGEFFQSLSDEFSEQLLKIDEAFQQNCSKTKAGIESCDDEVMMNLRLNAYNETLRNHFEVRSRLLNRFNAILDEGIDTLSGKTKGAF